jgi:hypothetical protein
MKINLLLVALRNQRLLRSWRSLALLLLLSGTFRAQAQRPANDEPCGAILLPHQGGLCTAPLVGNTVGATASQVFGFRSASCGPPAPTGLLDVWYRFTTAATGPASFGATLTVTGNPAGQIRLYQSWMGNPSCQTATPVGCSAASSANTAAPRLVTGALLPSTEYFVAISGYANNDTPGPFTICLTDGPSAPTCGAPTLILSVMAPQNITPTSAYFYCIPGGNNTPPTSVLVTGDNGYRQTRQIYTPEFSLTGLTPGHTYQVQATAPCAALGQAATSAPVTFTTPRPYCTANVGAFCGDAMILQVYIPGTQLDNRRQFPEGNNVGGLGCYTSYEPITNQTGTLVAGQSYQLNTLVRNSANITAWIDYNQNNVFEASENIMPAGPVGMVVPRAAAFTVPAGTLPGQVGLRVRSIAPGSSVGMQPGGACDAVIATISGETEDYTITLATPTATAAEALAAQVELFPNPAPHAATLRVPADLSVAPVAARLFNALGQEVYQQQLPAAPQAGHEVQLSWPHLPAGLYVLRLHTSAGPLSKRLVLE